MDRAGKGIRLNSQKRCELGEMPKVLALCELKGIELRNSPTLLRRAAQLGPAIQVWDALSPNLTFASGRLGQRFFGPKQA